MTKLRQKENKRTNLTLLDKNNDQKINLTFILRVN